MKSYDKASWHIDGGEKPGDVITRFKEVFSFLAENKMLSEEGEETLEFAMDSSVSLNSYMVNAKGKEFLDTCYDDVLGKNPKEVKENLREAYKKYKEED